MLELKEVSKDYGRLRALDRISLSVDEGEILGVMGANGAGKTTLFRLISGSEVPTGGEIRFLGESIAGFRPDQVCRRGIALTYQVVRPFAGLSVLENLEVAAIYGSQRKPRRAEARRRGRELLEMMGLVDRETAMAGRLTLVERKRLEIARAIATEARLVLLDEVMAGLTGAEVDSCLQLLRTVQINMGLTLVVIEHVMRALVRLSDRIVVLHHGVLLAQGAPTNVVKDPRVMSAYLGSRHGS